jgi:hypothetical protein
MSLQRRFKKSTFVPVTVDSKGVAGVHNEQHFSVPELAKLWGLSDDSIRELFRNELGVLKLARPEKMHKRGYTTLSIPESVARKVHERLHGRAA